MDELKRPKISLIASAGSSGYPYYIGACIKLFEANMDKILPVPFHMAGVSGGALGLATMLPWNEENVRKVIEVTPNLKPRAIYSYSSFLKIRLGSILGLKLANHFSKEAVDKLLADSKDNKFYYFVKGGELGLDLALTYLFLYEIFHTPSLFSNKPLYTLLSKNLDFDGIFNSEIKLDIVAADKKTGERIVFTNYRPEDKNVNRFLIGLMASAALPGLFPPVKMRDMELVDGGVITSIPIKEAINFDPSPDVIVLLTYKHLDDHGKGGSKESAIEITHDAWSITAHEAARRNVKGYEQVNKNLETLMKLMEDKEKMVKTDEELEEFYSIIEQFSFAGKKNIPIVLVQPDEQVPEMTFAEFNKEGLIQSMEIGYRAMGKAIPKIREVLNL